MTKMALYDGWLHCLCFDCAVTCIKLTTLKTEMLSLSTEQVQPGKRQCNVPMCLNPDLEGQPLRTRGWLSSRVSDCRPEGPCAPHGFTQQVQNIFFNNSTYFPPAKHLQGWRTRDNSSLNLTDKGCALECLSKAWGHMRQF